MEFLKPHQSHYLKRLSVSFLHTYSSSELRQASSLPTVCVNTEEDGAAEQLHRQRIEAELEILTTQTLARSNKRRSKYQAVTIPSSVKHQVTETAMARPRSPQRKNEVDHEYLQGLLDEQLAVIKQQLNSLGSERGKMEQRMEDLMNGIKDVREQSAQMPTTRIIVTSSTPGNIRRVHSMEANKKHMIKTDSQTSLAKYKSAYNQQMSTWSDEVDTGDWVNRQRFASVSSTGSSCGHRDSDAGSLTDSLNSSFLSSSLTSRRSGLRPPSISDYIDSPTPIPELPESPSVSRSVTPHVFIPRSPPSVSRSLAPHVFIPHSPLHRPRSSSSTTPPSALKLDSPKHHRMHSQPSPIHPSPIHPSLAQTLLNPSASSSGGGGGGTTRPRSGSFSMLASPRLASPRLALKATLSSQDLRNRSNSSPAPKKRSPGSKLKHNKKDQQLSYFRKNSFTDLETSLKGSQTSIATDDECELKGSTDNVAASSGDQESPTWTASGRASARVLRRSSLTGQIEHVANSRAQVRRNNSFNTSAITSVEGFKHAAVRERHSVSVQQPRKSLTPTAPRRVVYLRSKETTV